MALQCFASNGPAMFLSLTHMYGVPKRNIAGPERQNNQVISKGLSFLRRRRSFPFLVRGLNEKLRVFFPSLFSHKKTELCCLQGFERERRRK